MLWFISRARSGQQSLIAGDKCVPNLSIASTLNESVIEEAEGRAEILTNKAQVIHQLSVCNLQWRPWIGETLLALVRGYV